MDWLLILFGALLAGFSIAIGAGFTLAIVRQLNRERLLLYRDLSRLEAENDALVQRMGLGVPEEDL